MFGHSVLMLDNDFATDHGLSWNMRRGVRLFGIKRPVAVPKLANWPDTETGLNYLCRLAGIKPVLTGDEKNWARNVDEWIDHCRSCAGGALYRPDHYEKAKEWLAEAMREGWQRVREWRRDWHPEELPLPDEAPSARLPLPHFTPGNY